MQLVEYRINEVFNKDVPGIPVTGWSQTPQYGVIRIEDYIFREEMLRDMGAFWYCGDTAMKIVGHSGCGKTSFVEQWHAWLNLNLLKVVAHPRMEIADLIGHYVPTSDGGMRFHYGPLVKAAIEGLSILIDEYNVLDPGVATGLNALIEGGILYIPETDEVIRPAEGFRVFAATNPNDVGAGYMGRNTQDAANDDRFWIISMGYPKPEEETPLIAKVLMDSGDEGMSEPSIATMFAEKMVDVANRVRKQYCGDSDESGALDITLSTRSLKRWAALAMMFNVDDQWRYSLERAVTNRASKETAKAIHDIVDAVFGTG